MDLVQNRPLLGVLSAGLGVLSHIAYFIHGEHHESAPTLALLCVLVPALLFTGQVVYMNVDTNQAALTTTVLYMSYFSALWTSIIVYRLFFHRLNKFPGPFWAKVSKLYHAALVIRPMDNYLLLHRWHQKYGAFVRTGEYLSQTFEILTC
jgi:drug/metabolite transporter (DMT)-like permease